MKMQHHKNLWHEFLLKCKMWHLLFSKLFIYKTFYLFVCVLYSAYCSNMSMVCKHYVYDIIYSLINWQIITGAKPFMHKNIAFLYYYIIYTYITIENWTKQIIVLKNLAIVPFD